MKTALPMKTLILMVVIAFVAADSDYYEVDRVDINGLTSNTDELKRSVDCVLDRGECSKVYNSYKVITPEAIEEKCKRCSPHLKHEFFLYLQAVKTKLPSHYADYRHKYDPDRKYFDVFESELKKYSIAY